MKNITKNNNSINNYLLFFKMAAFGIDTLLQSLWEIIHRPVNHVLWNFVPCRHQTPLQRVDRLVGLRARFVLQNAPDAVVHNVQIRRIRRPLSVVSLGADVDVNDLREDVLDQVTRGDRLVGWGPVFLPYPVLFSVRSSGPWMNFGSQKISVQVPIHFDTRIDEKQRSLDSVSHSCPYHDALWLLGPRHDSLFEWQRLF